MEHERGTSGPPVVPLGPNLNPAVEQDRGTSSPPAVPPRPYLAPTVEHERGANKRRKGNTGAEIGYVNFNMEYPPFDALLAEDSASLQPNHPDERINYDGSFLIPTISKFTTTLYNTAAIFGRGNSNFSPKLPKNDDDVLAERALVNARRLATTRRERAHAWYALARRRKNLKIKLRELQVDHAIKTNRRPNFCNTKKRESSLFHQRKE